MIRNTCVSLEELADQAMHLHQDLAWRDGELILQKKVPYGASSGPVEIEPVEEATVQRLHAEKCRSLKLQHHVELVWAVDLRQEQAD